MKKLVVLLFVGLSVVTYGQKKKLELKDAVMQQYRAFLPEQMNQFFWIPNSSDFTYLDNYTTLKKGSAKTGKIETLLTIEELNKVLESKLGWFSGFEWIDQNHFMVNDGAAYYSYDVVAKTGQVILKVSEEAENQTLHKQSGNLAFTVKNNLQIKTKNGAIVSVTNNADPNIVSGQTYARNEFGIGGGIFWSGKATYLAFAQKDESGVADYPLLDITQTPGKLKNIKYPMAGQGSEKTKIGIFNLKTLKTNFIFPTMGDESYLTNVTWTPDEKFLMIAEVNRGQNHMKMNLYNAENASFVKTLFEEKNDKWIEPEHPAFFPSPISNNFVWISERDGFDNLYYYDINGTLIKQLTANKFVTNNIVQAIGKGTEIVFCATGENPTNNLYYAVTLDGKQRLLTKESGVHEIKISDDEQFIFDEYSSHDVPSKSLLLDIKGKEVKTLLVAENKLKDFAIGSAEIKTIKGNDGSDLYTRLIKPSNFDPSKKYPVLVYVYGGPHAQMITNSWLDGANLWMYWMAEQGYLVYTLDNRGSGHRGFAFESGIHRQLGNLEMEDQLTGVAYLKSLPYVDGNRLAVHGWSFGGFMTTSLMLRQAGTFNVGVAGGPVTDWKFYEIMYGERYMDKPEENPEGYKQACLMNHAQNLKGDLLLIHGTSDDVVVEQHNLSLVKKFVELGIQVDYFPYPMHKHNVGGKDRVHLMEKILTYVIEHNM